MSEVLRQGEGSASGLTAEQVTFLAEAIKDHRVRQALYLYRKTLGPGASFSQWCSKGFGRGCQCWRCLADVGRFSSDTSEILSMAESADRSPQQLPKIQALAEQGNPSAVTALKILAIWRKEESEND